MNNILIVICMLGLLTTILGGAFLAIRVANLQLHLTQRDSKDYLKLPSVILVIGFIVWVVTFFIVAPN